MIARLAWLALLLVDTGCSAPGRLVIPTAPFTPSAARVVFWDWDSGAVVVDLEGTVHEKLYRPGLYIIDASDDAQLFVLSDSDTNLYIAKRGGQPTRISALDKRLADAVLSPDGRTVAATRHADFDLPQQQWREDDAVYLIDVESGHTRVLPAAAEATPMDLAWEKGGGALWLTLQFQNGSASFKDAHLRVDVASGVRTRSAARDPAILRRSPLLRLSRECSSRVLTFHQRGKRGDEGLDVAGDSVEPRHLVVVTGRKRGFHDYRETTAVLAVTPDCRHALIFFGADTWAVDVETGALRRLGRGHPLFFDPAPTAESWTSPTACCRRPVMSPRE